MKKRWKLLLTLGLALVALSVLGYLGMATAPDIPNLVKYHKETHDSNNQILPGSTSQNCIKCHGDKRTESDLSNYFTSAHKKHNMSVYLRFNLLTPYDNDGDGKVNEDPPGDVYAPYPNPGQDLIDDDDYDGVTDEDGVESECAKCHYQTDTSLGQVTTNERGDVIFPNAEESFEGGLLDDISGSTSDRVARKQVDPALCVSCHGGFATDASPTKWNTQTAVMLAHLKNGQTQAEADPRGCTKCHNINSPNGITDPQIEHRYVPYVNLRYASTSISCLKCHGGYQWYDVQEMNYLGGFDPYWPQDAQP